MSIVFSVDIRLLECGYSSREGKELVDHEVIKVHLHTLAVIALAQWIRLYINNNSSKHLHTTTLKPV